MKPIFLSLFAAALCGAQGLGPFEDQAAVGTLLHPGSAEYDASRGAYAISSSGENMWAQRDDFYFVWKRVSGDTSIAADIVFPTQGGNAHRKAVLMIRQSLDADSAYVDAALHGDGLTSLQSRAVKGGNTHEVGTNAASPRRMRLEKRGDDFYLYLAREGEDLRFAGGSMHLLLTGPFYVGLGVCAHNKDVTETAVFSNVQLGPPAAGAMKLYSTLETVRAAAATDRRVVYASAGRIASPAWSPDGKTLLYSTGSTIERLAAQGGGKPERVPTRTAPSLLSLSPDGKLLAFSDRGRVSVMPAGNGGAARKLSGRNVSDPPSWSPGGKTLVYARQRGGRSAIYRSPAERGEESAIAAGQGSNRQPEFTADGKYVYFVSDRTGTAQVWRMKPDGSGQEQVTGDDRYECSDPRVSPDAARLVFLSRDNSAGSAQAQLRMMNLTDKRTTVIAELDGTEGTLGSPAWSPDSSQVAFVSRQRLP